MVFVVFSSSFSLAGFWLRDQYLIPVRFPLSLGKGMLAVIDCISPLLNQKACHHAITCWLSKRPTWNLSSGIQMVQVPGSWFMISDCLLQQCYFKRNVFVPINHLCWWKQWYTLGLWWYESYGSCNTSKKNGVDVDDVDHLASALRILRPTGPSRTASCQRNSMNLWVLHGPILSGGDQVLVPGSNARLIG